MLHRDRRDEGLRAVAAGHAKAVRAAGHCVARELLEVEAVVEHDGLDAEVAGEVDELEARDLAAAGPWVAQQHRMARSPGWTSSHGQVVEIFAHCGSRGTVGDRDERNDECGPEHDAIGAVDCHGNGQDDEHEADHATDDADGAERHLLRDRPPDPDDSDEEADEPDHDARRIAEQHQHDGHDRSRDCQQRHDRGDSPAGRDLRPRGRSLLLLLLSDRGQRGVDAGIEVIAVERLEQPVALDELLQPGPQLDERHVRTLRVQLLVELLEHPGRGDVDIGDGLALHDDPS